ncbi:hypothetical protein Vadar_027091 [Vaccinium darrowii]|uniref:Uncharacterized protein n=1 Tax=Vaccinium darrowii TaxID=229202 RepID=A0ACB7ZN34_9ERIC|nr:hypothetical protein Vadar_027091 [Vaccinium darrowii]
MGQFPPSASRPPSSLEVSACASSIPSSKRPLPNPGLPEKNEWRRAPFFKGEGDALWVAANGYDPVGPSVSNPLLLDPECEERDVEFIPLDSIFWFCIERGDFPYSFITYKSVEQPRSDWAIWVKEILADPVYEDILKEANLIEAISHTTTLEIKRSNPNLNAFVARWSRQTHTSFLQFGECGPTLEDVALLWKLGSRGRSFFDPLAMTEKDNALILQLKISVTDANKESSWFDNERRRLDKTEISDKCTWGNSIRHIFRDIPLGGKERPIKGPKYKKEVYFAGFISYFLSFFVLLGHPSDSPTSPLVFPLAVQLARGEAIPLGPLFLANLYHRLDTLHTDMERSSRRYDIWSYAHSSFLCAFLYSCFPSSAPAPHEYKATIELLVLDKNGKQLYDDDGVPITTLKSRRLAFSMQWNRKVCSGKRLLAPLMDSEDLVDQRPYSVAYDGIRSLLIQSPTNRVIDLPPKDRYTPLHFHAYPRVSPGVSRRCGHYSSL